LVPLPACRRGVGRCDPIRLRVRRLLALCHSRDHYHWPRCQPRALAFGLRRRQRAWLRAGAGFLALGTRTAQRRATAYALASGGGGPVAVPMKRLAAACTALMIGVPTGAAEPAAPSDGQFARALHESAARA